MYEKTISHVERILQQLYGTAIENFPSARKVRSTVNLLRDGGAIPPTFDDRTLIDLIMRSMALIETDEAEARRLLPIRKQIEDAIRERVDHSVPLDAAAFACPRKLVEEVVFEGAERYGIGPFSVAQRNAKELTFISEIMECKDGLKQRVVLDASIGGSPQISAQLALGANDVDSIDFSATTCFLRGPWRPAKRNAVADRASLVRSIDEPLQLASLSRDVG